MEKFRVFSLEHLEIVIFCLILMVVLLILANFFNKKTFARVSGLFILILKIAETGYRYFYEGEPWVNLLPLHLCNIVLIFVMIMMFTNSKTLFQLCYFWGAGAFFAILTPEIIYSLPDFVTISFFLTHFYIIFAVLYAMIYFGFRPSLAGYVTAFFIINLITLGVYYINVELGTNYLYVNRLPSFYSPLVYFGQWPYYIVVVESIYVILTYLMYLPFKKRTVKYGQKKFY